ncbi:MAG: hypothetical protein GX606_03120, partial [Elusimicrobia bacterium]|nr:hypothetical protein [Elusimicrobiota bacterium]
MTPVDMAAINTDVTAFQAARGLRPILPGLVVTEVALQTTEGNGFVADRGTAASTAEDRREEEMSLRADKVAYLQRQLSVARDQKRQAIHAGDMARVAASAARYQSGVLREQASFSRREAASLQAQDAAQQGLVRTIVRFVSMLFVAATSLAAPLKTVAETQDPVASAVRGSVVDRFSGIRGEANDLNGFEEITTAHALSGRKLWFGDRLVTIQPGMWVQMAEVKDLDRALPEGVRSSNGRIVLKVFEPDGKAAGDRVAEGGTSAISVEDGEIAELRKARQDLEADIVKDREAIRHNEEAIVRLGEEIAEADVKRIEEAARRQSREREAGTFAEREGLKPIQQAPVFVPSGMTAETGLNPRFVPDPVALAHVDQELAQLKKIASVGQESGLPIHGIFLSSYNRIDLSHQIQMGGGLSFSLVPDLPGRDILAGVRIGQALTEYGSQTALNQIAGPLFGAQIIAELRNYVAMHPTRGQDVKYNANMTLGKGILQTVTVHITPVESFDQNGNRVTKNLYTIGLVDTFQAGLGVLDKYLLGDIGFIGDSQRKFVASDMGYLLKVNEYHQGFELGAALNQDPNVIAVQVYEVNDAQARYRLTDKNGWEEVGADVPADPWNDYRSATVRGFVLRYDPQTRTVRGEEAFAAPTFMTDQFAKTLARPGEDPLRTPLFERRQSIVDKERERTLIKGVDQEGRVILGVLRHSVTGRIVHFVTDPRELNTMSSITDADGHRVQFVPGQPKAEPSAMGRVGRVVRDYTVDEVLRVRDEWAGVGGALTGRRPGPRQSPGMQKPMTEMPAILADVFSQANLIFDPGPGMQAVAAAGERYDGVLYFNDGRIPAPVTNMKGLQRLQDIYKEGRGAGTGVSRSADGQGYVVDGFAGKTMSGDTLVSVALDGKVAGIFSASTRAKRSMVENARQANRQMADRLLGLSAYGVATDVNTGRTRNLLERTDEFVTAKHAGVAGRVLTLNSPDGKGKRLQLTPDMLVKVDARGRVQEFLEAGLQMMRDREVILTTEGYEVIREDTGRPEFYAAKSGLTPEQERAGVRPAGALVRLVASNRVKMVPVDARDPDGLKRMVIERTARPMKPGLPVRLAFSLEEFQKHNALVIWRDGTSQYVSLEALNATVEEGARSSGVSGEATSQYTDGGKVFHGVTWSPIPAGKDRTSWSWNEVSPESIAALERLGVNSVRVYTPITSDTVLSALTKAGIRVVVSLPYYDDRGVPASEKFDIRSGSYARFIEEHFGKYPPGSIVEIGNEYNYHPEWFGNDVGRWYDSLEQAARKIHEINPGIIVATAHGEVPTADVLTRIPSVDAIGMNIYRGVNPASAVEEFLARIPQTPGANPNLRVYLSEFGVSSWDTGTGEQDEGGQARHYEEALRNLSGIQDPRFMGFFAMTAQDEAWKTKDGDETEGHYGLLRENGTEKPAFRVVRDFLRRNPAPVRPSTVVERGLSVEAGTPDLSRDALDIQKLDGEGEVAGRMVRTYGGKYVFWSNEETAANLDSHYQLIYRRDRGDNRPPIVEYLTLEQLRADFNKIRGIADQINVIRQKPGARPGEMEVVRKLHVSPTTSLGKAEVWARVDARHGQISLLTAPDQPIATTTLQNSFKTPTGDHLTVVERRGLSGAVESAFAVLTPEEGVSVSEDKARVFGDLYAQFFALEFENGSPLKGKAIVGYREGPRTIYAFSVTRGADGVVQYSIDWDHPIGRAVASTDVTLSADALQELGLTGKSLMLAEERDLDENVQRIFIIDPDTNEELGSINPLQYGEAVGNYYEAAVYNREGQLVSSLLSATQKDGKTELSWKKRISVAENQDPVTFDQLSGLVGPLSGELRLSLENLAREIGISFDDIRLMPSLKVNDGNGENVFYRIQGDPL